MLHFKRRFNEGVEAANPMAPRSHQDYENETSMHFSSGAMQARGEHGWLLVTGAPGDGGRCRGWMILGAWRDRRRRVSYPSPVAKMSWWRSLRTMGHAPSSLKFIPSEIQKITKPATILR